MKTMKSILQFVALIVILLISSACNNKNKPENSSENIAVIQDTKGFQLKEPVTIQLSGFTQLRA